MKSAMKSVTIVSVVGARPQFIKLAPVCRSLADMATHWSHRIVHTGQHYDYGMSDVFFADLSIPHPDANLNIGSGRQGAQTGAMIASLEQEFEEKTPDGVIVYGDTNSTLAAAIAASKLDIPLFHIEAGLRSFDRTMPEEINRIVADHCSEILFAPTNQAMSNLEKEGLGLRAQLVGDVMYDAVIYNAEIASHNSNVLAGLGVKARKYALVTVHRASNTDRHTLRELMQTMASIAKEYVPIVFPMHPRTRAVLGSEFAESGGGLQIVEPQSYIDMLSLVKNARLVLTDSGGLQKEAAFLGTPCVTLRDTTEWTETLDIGANRLVGLASDAIRRAVREVLEAEPADWSGKLAVLYGDGRAADRIAGALVEWFDRLIRVRRTN
jgi:UDP-N-acetylglucosamine 2-epimerase